MDGAVQVSRAQTMQTFRGHTKESRIHSKPDEKALRSLQEYVLTGSDFHFQKNR